MEEANHVDVVGAMSENFCCLFMGGPAKASFISLSSVDKSASVTVREYLTLVKPTWWDR